MAAKEHIKANLQKIGDRKELCSSGLLRSE